MANPPLTAKTGAMRAVMFAMVFAGAVLVWTVAMVDGLPLAEGPRVILAADLMVLTAISVVGMLIGHSRWARRLAVGLLSFCLVAAVWLEWDGWWLAGVLASVPALVGLLGRGFQGVVRQLPAAAGPPAEAVLLSLALFGAPTVLALTHGSGLTVWGWWAVAGSPVIGVWYAKTLPGALWLVRLAAPVLLILAGLTSLPWGVAGIVFGLGVGRLAWTTNARVAARPLVGAPTRLPAKLTGRPS